nr:MAG: hypothetical protein [Microvirus sp.]
MKIYKTIQNTTIETEFNKASEENSFIGESIEEKVRKVTADNTNIEAISPMIYTERKDGVLPEYNIRTDKWDIAQQAMNTIAIGTREKRNKEMDKPDVNSKVDVQNEPKKE